ncbi:MAG: amidase [Rhodospirillales bacterium]|jgi:aspartyl-tRNA(Asn)/glutamyl-tRNA(Gln) amidotransferase subunit A|nr:amidase [Rhodospirillales bacterium]MDP7426166.1 amidase [Rhodospirillales bacterium]
MYGIKEAAAALINAEVTARQLVDDCLARIEDPTGEGARAFLIVYGDAVRAQADAVDQARAAGHSLPPFAGVPISIKDLFDIAGEVTTAGSHVLDDQPAAVRDAPVMARLKQAGFIFLGKTNMTEFAYSGLGLNTHYPPPLNPYDRQSERIPGGSTSGGAVSVADGMALATIGTDTGGSCRIPAAFCGIVGFKSTTWRIPRDGVIPLSKTLDSVGPLAASVACCAVLDDVMSGGAGEDVEAFPALGLRLGVLRNYVTENTDQAVGEAVDQALVRLSKKGVQLTPLTIEELERLPVINHNGGYVGAEAYAWHRDLLESRGGYYDPWVYARFEAGKAQSAADFICLAEERAELIDQIHCQTRHFDAVIMPSVAIIPPTLEELKDAEVANATNRLVLRNTAIGNFLDRPVISLPCHEPGQAPVGVMLMGESGDDRRLLAIARGLEDTIQLDQQKIFNREGSSWEPLLP